MNGPILLVEDKDSLRTMLRHALEAQGHEVIEASGEADARVQLATGRTDLVLSDLRLAEGDGLGVLRAAKELDPDLPVIVMTAFGSIQDAVEAMKQGAVDFLAKPVDPDHLSILIDRALAQRRLAANYVLLQEEVASRRAPLIIGDDPRLRQVMSQLLRAAGSDATVLLEGESGTGKELFARTLHVLSPRADGPFVAINCAAIPENLLESELFGHEKGSFTGATNRKLGKFEVAHRGTIFLDEIGEMPLGLQAKILRALESRQFERVGGNSLVHVDVRLVSATNKNLKACVAARRFREDLYFRLSVFPVAIPPLRERTGDVAILARHFIERFCRDLKKKTLELSPDAERALSAYPWPGNVRELQNCIERAVILAEGPRIEPRHLNLSGQGLQPAAAAPGRAPGDSWEAFDLSGTLAQVTRRAVTEAEKRKIARAMDEAGGNKVRAAEMLQIGYKALTAKLREHGLER